MFFIKKNYIYVIRKKKTEIQNNKDMDKKQICLQYTIEVKKLAFQDLYYIINNLKIL